MHRKTIYRWREKYDGTAKSSKNKSRIPHSPPNEYIQEEIKLIKIVVCLGECRYNKTPSKKKEYELKPYE